FPLTFRRSTRMTSAPMSASSIAANGPGPIPTISTTFKPSSGPAMSFLALENSPCHHGRNAQLPDPEFHALDVGPRLRFGHRPNRRFPQPAFTPGAFPSLTTKVLPALVVMSRVSAETWAHT